jgi:hypothetical protein
MKEFAWINRYFFLNLAFGQVGEKIKAKTAWQNQNQLRFKIHFIS